MTNVGVDKLTSLVKQQLIDKAIDDLGGDISKASMFDFDGHVYLKYDVGYSHNYVLCHPKSYSVTEGLCFCTIEEFEQRKKEREMEKDWLYVGAFVERPDGFIDEVIRITEDNGVLLKNCYKYYCRTELKPFVGWYDYTNQKNVAVPPVDTECEYSLNDGRNWYKCKVVSHNKLVLHCPHIEEDDHSGLQIFKENKTIFRPLDWDKLSKRKQVIEKAIEVINNTQFINIPECAKALYDAGMLKLPEDK